MAARMITSFTLH